MQIRNIYHLSESKLMNISDIQKELYAYMHDNLNDW